MFAPPPTVENEVFARLPDDWHPSNETEWSRRRDPGTRDVLALLIAANIVSCVALLGMI